MTSSFAGVLERDYACAQTFATVSLRVRAVASTRAVDSCLVTAARIDGEHLAAELRAEVENDARALEAAGVGPGLASRVDSVLWLAVSAGPGLVWAVRPWVALGVQVDLVVPVVPTKFTVADQGTSRTVYEGSPAAGRAALTVEWRFN